MNSNYIPASSTVQGGGKASRVAEKDIIVGSFWNLLGELPGGRVRISFHHVCDGRRVKLLKLRPGLQSNVNACNGWLGRYIAAAVGKGWMSED